MPHVNSGGGDDLASSDEVKIYKDEGDEEQRQSENLSEDKLGLVSESEEVRHNIPYVIAAFACLFACLLACLLASLSACVLCKQPSAMLVSVHLCEWCKALCERRVAFDPSSTMRLPARHFKRAASALTCQCRIWACSYDLLYLCTLLICICMSG